MSERRIGALFDAVADRYENSNPDWPPQKLIDRMIVLAGPAPTDTVLDIGAGTGRLALAIAPMVGRVVGIDISEKMLSRAKTKAAQLALLNVEFRRGSFTAPGLSDTFSLIVSSLAFEWLPDSEKRTALDVAWRLLAPSGRLVLGERMLFFDPRADPDRVDAVLTEFLFKAAPQPTSASSLPTSLTPQQLAAAKVFGEEHQEFRMDPARLRALIDECGFTVEAVESVTPLLGVIAARKSASIGRR